MKAKSIVVSFISISFIFISCGGGGGGGSSDPITIPTIQYTGISEIVTLNHDNIKQITLSAVGASTPLNSFELASINSPQRLNTTPLTVANSLKDISKNIIVQTPNQISSAVYTESRVVFGSCGGRADITLNMDDSNLQYFWGSVIFSNYCDGDIVLDGNTTLDGNIDPMTLEIPQFTLSFDYFTSKPRPEEIL